MPRTTKARFIAAAALAPWAAPVVVVIVSVVAAGEWPYQREFPGIVFYSVLAAYVGLFAAGLPIVYALRRTGHLSVPVLGVAGAVAGVLILYLAMVLLGLLLNSSASFGKLQLMWGAALGFGVAIAFGLISGITMRWRATR